MQLCRSDIGKKWEVSAIYFAFTYDKECGGYVFICRDRMAVFWQSIQDHLYSLLVNATEHTFMVERAVVGLLRLTIRLLRRDEIAAQV